MIEIFKYEGDFDTKGICYNLGTHFGKVKFSNPAKHNEIHIKSSSLVDTSDGASELVGRDGTKSIMTVANLKYPWIAIDFKEKFIKPTHYTLRHYAKDNNHCIRNWQFEVCNLCFSFP